MTGTHDDALAEEVATACQVLAATGLAEHILGHVSARLGPDSLLVRCRGPRERGLAATTAEDVHALTFDRRAAPGGSGARPAERAEPAWPADDTPRTDHARPADDTRQADHAGPAVHALPGGYAPPAELPIHTEIMRVRPDVTAVVHAHPPDVVALSIAGFPLEPVVGAYDIPAARIAAAGIPVWPRACLVNTPDLGRALAGCLGDRPVAILRGHGLVSVAGGPPDRAVARAVVQAVSVAALATMILRVRATGAVPEPIAAEDLAGLPDLGDGLNVEAMWRHLTALAARKIYGVGGA